MVLIDLPVAQYYDQYPLQLAHDFPSEPQGRLWRYIGDLLARAQRDDDTDPAVWPIRAEDVAPVLAALEQNGQLRADDRWRWASKT